ncbi:MAG: valine--tRNA ligase [Flavobacteriales bacterium]
MNIPTQYNPNITEAKWYQYWIDNRFFNSTPNEKSAYTIVIPPPNVTGVLHMGHMLNNTIQDVLIRRARMNGLNACWVPGTDHASIATEAKVVDRLKKQGISKENLTREEFLEKAWDWTNEHGGIILEQLKTLGASCDWDRTKFTLDKNLSESVNKVFIKLYEKGLIYRGFRMVNWDPEAKTTLSDEEVIYVEKQGKLYHVQYQVEGSNEYITIVTTRPETILGDTAVCVNPNDDRYKHLVGKKVIVPIANRIIPIIQDDYVDMEFGTGCLKITPAHDINDQEIGNRHNLEVIDIFNENATLNANGLHYNGKDRFVVRKEIEKELADIKALRKVEDYTNKVGTSERTKAIIEPRLSVQWFLKMEKIAKKALDVVEKGEVKFYPQHYINTYRHWLENIRDWNISRQLWWGHRIPAYYYGEGKDDFVVAETIEKALELAKQKTQNSQLTAEDLKQDEDALDTWFSSWLWPISVFDGINNPNNEEIAYYYPTSDLVTGPDIIFFWVARMIMAGNEFRNQIPFKNVYFTGIVRDKQRRKMSKSLGNSPDPIELMKQYGADGVRVGVLLSSSAGSDLMFDEDLCLQGRNFSNKIWNAFRLIKGWEVDVNKIQPANTKQGIQWFENKLNLIINQLNSDFDKFRISDALMKLYKLVWDDFCSSFLEIIKPVYGEGIDLKTLEKTIELFEKLMQLLHPFMPFLTEEIWQHIANRDVKEAITISIMPKSHGKPDENLIKQFEEALHIISNIRTIRKEKQIPFKDGLTLVKPLKSNSKFDAVIEKLTHTEITISDEKPERAFAFRVEQFEYFVPLKGSINIEAERAKLNEELSYQQGFLKSVEKKLNNEKFMNGAPKTVVANECKKREDALAKIKTLEESLANL